jgi:hypothetical protein
MSRCVYEIQDLLEERSIQGKAAAVGVWSIEAVHPARGEEALGMLIGLLERGMNL